MLPIVQRELQTAARHPKLYRTRFIGWGAVFFFVCLLLPASSAFSTRGAGTFKLLTTITLLLCLFEGLRKTADAISIERREGTLGLLFLSTLSGFDIILGKLSAAAIRSLTSLLTFLPAIAVTLLLGGTTGGEFWRTILVLILALIMSLSVCLCVSTLTRENPVYVCGAILLIICALPFVALPPIYGPLTTLLQEWILPASPFAALHLARDIAMKFDPWPYWRSIAYLLTFTAASLFISSLVLPRSWQDRPFVARRVHPLAGRVSPKLQAYRHAMFDRNAVMGLFFEPRKHRTFRQFLVVLTAMIAFGAGAVFYVAQGFPERPEVLLFIPTAGFAALALVAAVRVARSTSYNFAEARANGALELILSTPLKVREILNGQWLAIRADLKPAFPLSIALAAVILFVAIYSGEISAVIFCAKNLAEAVFAIATVATVGVWSGLTARSPARAFFRTLAWGLVAPFLICSPTIVNQGIIFAIALDKIQFHFRRFVAEQYMQPHGFLPPPLPPQHAPPVIRAGASPTQKHRDIS